MGVTKKVNYMLVELDKLATDYDYGYSMPITINTKKTAKKYFKAVKKGNMSALQMVLLLDILAIEYDYGCALPVNSGYHLAKMIAIVNSYL